MPRRPGPGAAAAVAESARDHKLGRRRRQAARAMHSGPARRGSPGHRDPESRLNAGREGRLTANNLMGAAEPLRPGARREPRLGSGSLHISHISTARDKLT